MHVCLEAFDWIIGSPSSALRKSLYVFSPLSPVDPGSIDFLTGSPMRGSLHRVASARTRYLQ